MDYNNKTERTHEPNLLYHTLQQLHTKTLLEKGGSSFPSELLSLLIKNKADSVLLIRSHPFHLSIDSISRVTSLHWCYFSCYGSLFRVFLCRFQLLFVDLLHLLHSQTERKPIASCFYYQSSNRCHAPSFLQDEASHLCMLVANGYRSYLQLKFYFCLHCSSLYSLSGLVTHYERANYISGHISPL